MAALRQARALALSCHPIPTVAVTAMSAGLSSLAGLSLGRGALVTAAVFTGQLSIGWSNDYLDAGRDRAVQREDKPVASGDITPRVAGVAAVVALLASIAASVALGWPGGAAALVIVACGWAYNLGLKSTALSWLPYAVAFGMLPAVASLSSSPPRWPPSWAMAAGALLGVAAHLANVLPDLRDDDATGVRGLPHRLGAKLTALGAALVLLTASALILWGPEHPPGPLQWAAFAVAVTVAGATSVAAFRNPSSKSVFLAIMAIAVIDIASFALSGTHL